MLRSAIASPKAWSKIVEELRKCVLLCSNCHKEIHNGITQVPSVFDSFDEEFAEYKDVNRNDKKPTCVVCGSPASKYNKTCSTKCAATLSRTVDWDSIDLENLLSVYKTYAGVARVLNISDAAVRKRTLKLGISRPK